MTEWLGNGLQNRLQQFESAWHLLKRAEFSNGKFRSLFCMCCETVTFTGWRAKDVGAALAVRAKMANFALDKFKDMRKRILTASLSLMVAGLAMAQTQVVAHRGFWTTDGSAQNSLASFAKADSVGCYGSEFDLWVTKDNKIVVHHDANVKDVIIEDANYADFVKYPLANGEQVPTLEQYLELGKKLKTQLVCEIKPHKNVARTLTCVDMTLKAMKKYKLTKRVTYITFSLPALVKLISEAPKGTEVYYLNGELTPAQLKEMGAAGLDYSWGAIKNNWQWIDEAHKLGLKVNIWTVDDESRMQELKAVGVDYITTNQPVVCAKVVK